MELLIAGAIGVLGYTLSKTGAANQAVQMTPVKLGAVNKYLEVPRPGTYPIDVDEQPTSAEAFKIQRERSEEQYQLAADPKLTGVVSSQYPFFSSYRKQHTNDDLKQRRMELHTGLLKEQGVWDNKKEAPALFQPQPQPVTSSGSSGNGPNYDIMRKAAGVSGIQNNTLPFQQIRVGPGIGVGANVAASDGFHSQYRVLPPDAYSYKRNELPGQIVPGSAPVAARTADPKFYSKGVPRFYSMEQRPLEKGGAAVTAARVRPEVVRTALCHTDTQEYFGIAGQSSHRVKDGDWARGANERQKRPGPLPSTNITGDRAGVGGYVDWNYDPTKFQSQQREHKQSPSDGMLTGNHFPGQATNTYLVSPTNRTLTTTPYGGVARHYVASGESRPYDAPTTTLREQLHDHTSGPGIAAPTLTGATIQCTDRQLHKEAKRGKYSINQYVTMPERTEAFRRATFGQNADLLANRCTKQSIKVRIEPKQPQRPVGHGTLITNNAAPGEDTNKGRNKLEAVNRFQDLNIAKVALQGNPLHIAIN